MTAAQTTEESETEMPKAVGANRTATAAAARQTASAPADILHVLSNTWL